MNELLLVQKAHTLIDMPWIKTLSLFIEHTFGMLMIIGIVLLLVCSII